MKNQLKEMTVEQLTALRDKQTDGKRIDLINAEIKRR